MDRSEYLASALAVRQRRAKQTFTLRRRHPHQIAVGHRQRAGVCGMDFDLRLAAMAREASRPNPRLMDIAETYAKAWFARKSTGTRDELVADLTHALRAFTRAAGERAERATESEEIPLPDARDPLALSLSTDGFSFDKSFVALSCRIPPVSSQGGCKRRNPGGGSPGPQYPQGLVQGDFLYVIMSMNKEDVWVMRAPLSALA